MTTTATLNQPPEADAASSGFAHTFGAARGGHRPAGPQTAELIVTGGLACDWHFKLDPDPATGEQLLVCAFTKDQAGAPRCWPKGLWPGGLSGAPTAFVTAHGSPGHPRFSSSTGLRCSSCTAGFAAAETSGTGTPTAHELSGGRVRQIRIPEN